jgi:hypothetical protein
LIPNSALYLNATTGKPKKEGDIVLYPQLAKTYRRLAKYGGDDFYKGKIARDIVQELTHRGKLVFFFHWPLMFSRSSLVSMDVGAGGQPWLANKKS